MNQLEILEMNDRINQVQYSVKSLFNRVDNAEDRISEMEDKVTGLEHLESIKENK